MVKVWFPSMYMRLVGINKSARPAQAVFHVPPSMTKTEVREYLSKIYKVPVINVFTANFLGIKH